MNNIYHFHSRKELYGKNVNIYRKEKSNKEYFKYSNVMYDVKNYKKIKLDKSNINFKRGGGPFDTESLRARRQESESLIARDKIDRELHIQQSEEQRAQSKASKDSYLRSLRIAGTEVDEDKKVRILVKARYRLLADKDNRSKSFNGNVPRASSAENEAHYKKRDKLIAEIEEDVRKELLEEALYNQSRYA